MDEDMVRARAYEISLGVDAGAAEENWLRAEREFAIAHDYDTFDRDLEQLGIVLSRLPTEAGAMWRLTLPRGERVEAWEPATQGLSPPDEIRRLVRAVAAGKQLVAGPPASRDPGATRIRELLEAQRRALLVHDPGVRVGIDPENLRKHRVAARRARALVRAAARYLDPVWQRSLERALARLGAVTGPVRDLDVVLAHLTGELERLSPPDRVAGEALASRLRDDRQRAQELLVQELDGSAYLLVCTRLRFPPRLRDGVDAVPIERIARREFKRVAKAVDRLGPHPQPANIHRLRIALKRARYAVELIGGENKAEAKFLAAARLLQDLLGQHQDAVVVELRLRAATVEVGTAAAGLVAGRVIERQRARRAHVEARLPAAWKGLRTSRARLE